MGLLLAPFLVQKFKGMSAAEILAYMVALLKTINRSIITVTAQLIKKIQHILQK
jgi:hypothetical protein